MEKSEIAQLAQHWNWNEMWLVWGFAQWASEQEKLLPSMEIFLRWTTEHGFFQALLK